MDEQQQNLTPEEEVQSAENAPMEGESTGYVPRPMWQVWLARIGLVLFIALIIMYYINLMRG